MAYIDKHGVEFSDDRKTLIKCPKDFHGEYVIPNSVTSIGDRAFSDCTSLTSVTIPNSVTGIGDYAFWRCSGLISVYISDVATWCAVSFGNLFANPLCYAHNLYLNGTLVTDLVIPSSVTSIEDYAFCGCSGLTSVTIPNSVTSIGDYAFWRCSGLTSVTIPNSVTSIGDYAFWRCSGLTSVTIPNSVTSIGADAFYECSSLTSVHIYDVAAWCAISFANFSANPANPLYYAHNLYLNGTLVTDLVIPSSVTSIGDYAFCGCSGLTSVTIPNSVTSIGEEAFSVCSGLTSVSIPNSVTSIGSSAFGYCTGLTSVTIPNSVTNIGENAFYGCSGLQKIIIPKGQKERFIQMDGLKELEQFCVEEEDIINEKAAIRRLLYKNNIPYFYHFTSRKNLASIRKHGGLYSWLYLKKHEIDIPVQGGGELSQDLDRFKGLADYVHLSFCESHPMAYHHKKDGEDMVVLKISTEVALQEDTKFSDMNAVDSKCQCEQGLKGLKLVNFNATKEIYLTSDNPLFKFKQAEILVKTHVPLEYILNIDEL